MADAGRPVMDFWKLYDEHYSRVRKFIRTQVRDTGVASEQAPEL